MFVVLWSEKEALVIVIMAFVLNNKNYHCEQTKHTYTLTHTGLSSGVRHCASTHSGTDRHIVTPPGLQLGSWQVNQSFTHVLNCLLLNKHQNSLSLTII